MQSKHEEIIQKMKYWVDEDTTGHDIHHHKRVYKLGKKISNDEGGNKDIISAACLTHDLHRVLNDNQYVSPSESLPYVENILRDVNDYSIDEINEILYCVKVHENYNFEENPTYTNHLEAEIVQDADNLDALGAIGIGRAFMFSGTHNNPMWRPERKYGDSPYKKEEINDSTIYHLQDKILKLKDDMNTETARKIAEDRHKFVKDYVERFKDEWHGEL